MSGSENRYYDIHVLGAYETSLSIMQQFFSNGDIEQEPQVSIPQAKSWILNTVGLCLMSLGRLATAVSFYERKTKMQLEYEDWRNASIGYQNLASLNVSLGRLADGAAAANRALTLARRAENKRGERQSLAYQGWIAHLRGELAAAGDAFAQAEALEREIDSSEQYLYAQHGVRHATHLWRVGQAALARRVTTTNLTICERNRWANQISWCRRLLGDLDGAAGDHASAADHYAAALQIARSISYQAVLIEALVARGRWAAQYHADLAGWQSGIAQNLSGLDSSGLLPQAFSDLREALSYAVEGGYRLYEADIRLGLAYAHRAADDPQAARQEAQRARALSQAMGYHWGLVEADALLTHPGAV